MSNIKALPGVTIENEPVPEIIDILEQYLEKAKSGDLRAVAIAGIDSGGAADTVVRRGDAGNFAVIGAMELLKFKILDWIVNK